jgi:hypothetical protein
MNLKSLLASRAKKAVFLIILVIVVLAASGYAYFASLPPKSGPRASILSSPVEFTIELSTTEFTRGPGITVRATLRNISNKTITLTWGDYFGVDENLEEACFDFIVVDVNNSQVYRESQYGGTIATEVTKTLGPNEQMGDVFVWDQKTHYKDPEPVPKGTYSIRASTRPCGLTVDDQTSGINLETPSITFTID